MSMSRHSAADNAPPQPSPSPRGSNVSIGTCNDLQANLGFYSVKNISVTTTTTTRKPSDSPQTPEEEYDGDTRAVNCHHHQRNLLRVVAVSDRDIPGGDAAAAALVAPDAGRRRSAEDSSAPSIRTSHRKRFNRDTNHAVEDWLSLESSSSSRRPSVVRRHRQQTTSPFPAENDVTRRQTTADAPRRMRTSRREQTSPVSCLRRSADDLRILSAAVLATVFLALPWTMAVLVLGLRTQNNSGTAGGSAPSMLLFLLQCVSSLGVLARPVIYHVTHGGFRRAFWNLKDRLMLNRFR